MLAAAVAAALACAPLAHAQSHAPHTPSPTSDTSTNPRQLDTVHVFGTLITPLPANSSTLGEDALAARRAANSDSAQLLQGIPGLSLQGAGGVSALPSIHGLGGDRNRVVVDGIDALASCPNHMNPPLSYIAPSKVGEVRVYAGITPVSAGGDSIGGSIQVQSQAPYFADPDQGWQLRGGLGLGLRSNGNVRNADVTMTLADDVFNLSADASVARAGNYRAAGDFRDFTASGREDHEIPRDEVASSSYDVRNQSLRAAIRHGTQLLQASLWQQQIPLQGFPNQRMDMNRNDQRRWQLGYQGSHDWGALDVRVADERLRHSMNYGPDRQYWYGMDTMVPGINDFTRPCAPLSYTCAAEMPMEIDARTRSANVMARLDLSDTSTLRIGGEWLDYRLDDWWPPSGSGMWPEAFWNLRDGRRQRSALFAEWEGALDAQWTLLAGLRHARVHSTTGKVQGYDNDPTPPGSWMMTDADMRAFNQRDRVRNDTHLDASLLLRYTPDDRLDVEVGIARKNRSPNLYERYAWSTWAMAAVMNNTTGDGNGYVGDMDLRAERASTIAMTVDWHAPGSNKAWQLRMTPWYTTVDDYIDVVPVGAFSHGRFNVLRHANQSARLYGVDMLAETRLLDNVSGQWRLRASGNWQRSENRDTGSGLYNTMPAHLRLGLQQRIGGWDNLVEVEGVAAKTRVSAVRNEIATAGYGLLHLRGSRAFGQWRVDFGVENALDRQYAHPLGGAYVAQGRTMGINAIPWGITVPGTGRSFYAAARWSM